ncbi:MAG TPA: ABC transporter ATP-binding protein [Candidatus Dormibacteraeota bacterium]|nr:ABC transporter ATP-binding protein [Candidatus Dormibacteraeota bacterium]
MAGLDVPAIVTENLSKRYGSVRALVDLDLSVDCGEIFGFLGPNGAGKSTTIRLLLGYIRPTSGRAAILGLDTQRQHIEILRRVGYLPSYAVFEEVVTGLQALDDLAGVAGTKPSRRAEICEWVRLDDATLRRKVRDYSKGTRRKLGVVQALQHDPEVVIMDEPTEGLDPLVQHSFYAMLEQLRQEGKTIFFSSHVISEVERVCDRVAIIRQGSLVTVEHISTLVARRQRHVEARFHGPAPDLSSIPGVTNVFVDRDTVTCRFAGDVRPLLQHLVTLQVRDLTIEQARLEDVFLELYGEGEV